MQKKPQREEEDNPSSEDENEEASMDIVYIKSPVAKVAPGRSSVSAEVFGHFN